MRLRMHARHRIEAMAVAIGITIALTAPLAVGAELREPRKPRTPDTASVPVREPRTPDVPDAESIQEAMDDVAAANEQEAVEQEAADETPEPEPEPEPTPAQIAVETAREQLGDPYVWAAAGPDAFDCSGLTMYAWAAAGVQLPHNSTAQYRALPKVSLWDLRPGDLVFSGSGGIGHVGLYIGDGQMIHSPRSGEVVQISPLRSNYIGAARPAA